MQLLSPAVIIPDNPMWGSQVLGTGSVVLRVPQRPSPLTGSAGVAHFDEVYVKWMDAAGRTSCGWLAGTTEWKRTQLPLGRKPFHTRDSLTAWDHLRSKIYGLERDTMQQMKKPSAISWMVRYAREHHAELHAVVRQFGGKAKKTDTTEELTCRALSLILNRRITMKTVTDTAAANTAADTATATAKKATKKSGKSKKTTSVKKAATKKTATKKAAPAAERVSRAPSTQEIGERTLVVLKKSGIKDGTTDGIREATLLSKGKSLNAASLTTLRKAINNAKSALVEKKQKDLAIEANRLVRKVRTLLYDKVNG